MRKKLCAIRNELGSYTRLEKLFLILAMICSFCIGSEYAITKGASNSIFIAHYSVKLFPYAWLATVPLNFLIVSLYNRFLFRLGCFWIFFIVIAITIGIHLLCACYVADIKPLSFILYVWKDLYVLLMFQSLWSVIHSVIKPSRAKYLYGILYGMGGVGSVLGSMIPSFFAVKIGSEHLLFISIPIHLLLTFVYYYLLKSSNFLTRGGEKKEPQKASEGFCLIRASPLLKFILFIVVLMQIATTVMDFQFNTFLEQIFPDQDGRTEFSGRLWAVVNTFNLCFQFVATFLIVQFLGLKGSHFFVPSLLFANAIGSLFYPGFAMVSYSFIVIKTFDYSIFNIIKEMLYVPLKRKEKFKAKVVIEVFAYRSAKAFASLIVIVVQSLFFHHLPYVLTWVPLVLYVIWLGAVYIFMKKPIYSEESSELESITAPL